ASASDDRTVRIWDAVTGTLQQTLKGHSDEVKSVAFSHDSKLLASASDDRTVRIWDAATGTLEQTLKGHSDWVNSVAFSHDSKLLASASDDRTVRIWDAVTGTPQQNISVNGHITSLLFDITDMVLITNIGRVKLRKFELVSLSESSQEGGKSDRKELAICGSWVTWNAQNLLWLPPDYRAICFDISLSGSTLAVGCQSGKFYRDFTIIYGVFELFRRSSEFSKTWLRHKPAQICKRVARKLEGWYYGSYSKSARGMYIASHCAIMAFIAFARAIYDCADSILFEKVIPGQSKHKAHRNPGLPGSIEDGTAAALEEALLSNRPSREEPSSGSLPCINPYAEQDIATDVDKARLRRSRPDLANMENKCFTVRLPRPPGTDAPALLSPLASSYGQ
ncbi:hypothetical protein V498_00568, partial [Pseudogymnoascus sp. VKM F-4517 (FW-2822)]